MNVIVDSALRSGALPPQVETRQPVTFVVPCRQDPPKVLAGPGGALAFYCRSVGEVSDVYVAPDLLVRAGEAHHADWLPHPGEAPAFRNGTGLEGPALMKALLRWSVGRSGGKIVPIEQGGAFELVEAGPGRQVWRETRVQEGFVARTWYAVASGSPIVDFFSTLKWSDRVRPTWSVDAQGMLSSESPFVIDQAPEQGWHGLPDEPTLPLALPGGGTAYVASQQRLGDGQALWARGSILLGAPDAAMVARARTMFRGVARRDEWGSAWFGAEPVVDERWHDVYAGPALPTFGARRHGMQPNNGQSGGVDAFGTVPALPQSALAVLRAEVACTSFFRGIMNCESDGSVLRSKDHPAWMTWSGRTHTAPGFSPDRLGKVGAPDALDFSGYTGADYQHRCQNDELAALAALGCYGLEELFAHQAETDQAQAFFYYDSPRAVGRLLMTWVSMSFLSADPRPREWAERRLAQARAEGPCIGMPESLPVRPIQLGGDYSIGEPGMHRVVHWEHSLASAGSARAFRRWGLPDALWVLQDAARTTVQGFFRADVGLRSANSVLWEAEGHIKGTQWPLEVLKNGPGHLANPHPVADRLGWLAWMASGALAMATFPVRDAVAAPEQALAAAIFAEIKATGVLARSEYSRFCSW